MTHGRHRNDAIVVARSDDAARAEIAETMLRGAIESTIEDARAAARSELSRTARTRERMDANSRTPSVPAAAHPPIGMQR